MSEKRVVPEKLNNILFRRGAIITKSYAPEAAFFLDRLSVYEIRMLKRDFGFDFTKQYPEEGFAFYRYNLEKAKAFLTAAAR